LVALFNQSTTGRRTLSISAVNLAEVLTLSGRLASSTGVDLSQLLTAWNIAVHQPDLDTARRVAALASVDGLSLADRFAAATAQQLHARLYTTDRALATASMKRRIPVSRI